MAGLVVLSIKLALVPLVFDPSADVPFVVPKALLSHGLTYVLIGILTGLLIEFGRPFIVWSSVHLWVLAFLAISSLAAVFAANTLVAFSGTHVRMLGLATIADGVITYFAAVHLIRARREAYAVGLAVLAGSLPIVGYELLQYIGRDPFPWSIDASVRPFGTVGQPTTLAEYLSILSVAVFGAAVLTAGVELRLRLLALAYSVVLLIGAGFTGTRSAIPGIALGAVVFAVLVWAKHPDTKTRRLVVMSGAIATAAVIAVVLLTPLGARIASTVEASTSDTVDEGPLNQLEPSISTRLAIYGIAFDMVRNRPVIGYGPDNFAVGVPEFRPEIAPLGIRQSIATSAHSWIAAVATSSGVSGLLAFVGIVLSAFIGLIRRSFHPIGVVGGLAVATYLGTGLTTVNAIETDTLFWLGIAAMVGAISKRAEGEGEEVQKSRPSPRSPLRRTQIALVPVLCGLVLMLTTWNAFEASRAAGQSQSSRTPARVAQAVASAARATQLDGNRGEYWQALALANVAAKQWTAAGDAFERAARLLPYDVRFLTDAVQVQLVLAQAGDPKPLVRAMQLADRAVQVDPRNPRAHLTRAVVSQVQGNTAEAVSSAQRALALDPGSTNDQLYVTASQAYISAGRFDDAVRTARDGLAILGSTRKSVPLRVELARALASSGHAQEAIDVIDAALGLSPGDDTLLRLRAQIIRL